MIKKWNKIGKNIYELSVDGLEIGTLHMPLTSLSQKATAKVGDKLYIIQRKGFWKNKIEITDETGTAIARVYSEKWFSKYYILEFKLHTYRLLLRNNPLAEWVVLDDTKELLAYRLLAQKGSDMNNVALTDQRKNPDFLLDCLLWYLFVPIAHEHISGDISFIVVMSAS